MSITTGSICCIGLSGKPTEPAAWWDDCDILGGRDGVAGGTWLGCSRTGKVAFLTNVLDLHTPPKGKSRGELPVLFLQSTKTPKEFAEELVKVAHLYKGFNMIMADIPSKTMLYISNRPKGESVQIQEVPPGIHVLANAQLDSPSYKSQRLRLNLKSLLCEFGEDDDIPIKETVDKLMKDRTTVDKSRLPGIIPVECEFNLSSIFVEEMDTPLGHYGTRSCIALTVKASREVCFHESYLEDESWKERTVTFCIQKLK